MLRFHLMRMDWGQVFHSLLRPAEIFWDAKRDLMVKV
jgi:hypothetical protein